MILTPDIARLESPAVRVAHCLLPPWRDGDVVSVTQPGSIGVAFTNQAGATIRRGNGRVSVRDVPAGSVGLGGSEPIAWLRVGNASDVVEITASAELRREIAAELRASDHADLDDLHGWSDPVLHAIALRFRAGTRGWLALVELEYDALTRAAYARVLQLKFGGAARAARALDQARLARVIDYVTANLDRQLSIAELADIATLSPYHFARSFQRSSGLAPHRFVMTLRLDRAMDRLKHSSMTVEQTAVAIGLSNLSHFRRMFRAQFGKPPSAFRS